MKKKTAGTRKRGGRENPPGRSLLPLAGGIAALVFLLYLPSLGSEFVYDAEAQIVIGTYVHEPEHLMDVLTLRVLSQDLLDGNRPVQLLSLMLDSVVWRKNPFGYHLTSSLLHAANAALLFLLLAALLRRGSDWKDARPNFDAVPAALAALVFAVHPVLVEPVAEVSCREDLLVGFFLLAAIGLALRCAAGQAPWWTGAACLLSVFLACAAKESGVVVPFVLLLCGVLFRQKEPLRRWLFLTLGALVAAVVFLALRFAFAPETSEIFVSQPKYLGGSLAAVFSIQPRIWAFSIRSIFWPASLSADYVGANVLSFPAAGAWIVLLAFVAAQLVVAWKNRLGALGFALFWLGLAPVSNFVPIYRPVADRYLYLPLMGLAFTLCGLLVIVAARPRVSRVVRGAVLSAVLALAVLAWKRQAVFANSLNLWTDTLKNSPWSDTAANNLGYALLEKEQWPEALKAFEKALNLTSGKKANAWAGAAIVLENQGRHADAFAALEKAIAIESVYTEPDSLVRRMNVTAKQAAVLGQILRRR